MKRSTCLFMWMHVFLLAYTQQQRALIIGIDTYSPNSAVNRESASGRTEWPNLNGCKNDALAMKNEVVIRWGFKNENIRELYDTAATRKDILLEIDRLFNASIKGDIAFIYYAGHGSQVRNSKSPEQDKLDESIVPSDVWREGVEDIRDKTLATLINKFIDKGVILTTIYDCCHSGSIGRGFNDKPPVFRYLKASNRDVMDPTVPVIPELRSESSYLVISASQENEPAQEQQDDHNIPHGAFTIALLKAMNQQSVDASVSNLFNATRAIIKSNGKKQEPVLAGSSSRLRGTMFGLNPGILPDKTLIPLISVSDSILEFQGGFMAGLNVDNELTKTGSSIRVKIIKMIGANRSQGIMMSGKITDVHPGELFEVSNWVSSSAPFLKLYIPDQNLSFEQVEKISAVSRQVKQSAGAKWITDLEKQDPDVSIYYRNNQWMANDTGTRPLSLSGFSDKTISSVAKGRSVFVNIPPPASLVNVLKQTLSSVKSIQLTSDPNDAQYALSGNIDADNRLSYGWIRSQVSAGDSLESMPLQTRMIALSSDTKEDLDLVKGSLYESCLKLSRIRAWLSLQVPHATSQFPFHLEVRNDATNKTLGGQGIAVGNKLSFYFAAGENYLSKWDRKKRFIYVFFIDRNGNMTLIYPQENSGNVNNRFPLLDDNNQPLKEVKLLEGDVTEPVGTDTYFLLATEEPVPDYSYAFNQEGVRGSGTDNRNHPLYDLINLANPSARGLRKPIVNNWNLERVGVKTHH